MKTMNSWIRGARLLVVLTAAGAGVGHSALPASAHEGQCPVCKLDIPQDTEQQDNEVALRSGRKRIEYRCVFCAVSDAKSFTGDVTVLAPSEQKGRPVLLSRSGGNWSAQPASALFVARKTTHRDCSITYRAFTTRPAFDAYTRKHAALLGDAPPLTLSQFLVEVK